MKLRIFSFVCSTLLPLATFGVVAAQDIHMSYPGLTGESAPLWVAREAGLFKAYGIDAKLVYMEGGRPLIVDALWTSRKFAEENPQVVENVLRGYTRGIARLVKDRETSIEIMRKYMRNSDPRVVQGAYDRYVQDVDRVPIPSDKAIKTTLEISHRVAPKLAGIDINRHMYFAPVQKLVAAGFIDKLYK